MKRLLSAGLPAALLLTVLTVPACARQRSPGAADLAAVRKQLEVEYEKNRQAFFRKDVDAIMALRDTGFFTVPPDSQRHDRAWMRQYTEGLLNGIERWIDVTLVIDSLELVGNEARAIVRQHADRMALRPDGKVHHVETWVIQRETWIRRSDGWKLYRVDNLRDQRRLVDGKPG